MVDPGSTAYQSKVDDVKVMAELLDEAGVDENSADAAELARVGLGRPDDEIDELEIRSFLNGPHDAANAFLSIHAGAGGTESCDWADMLLRMYLRWAERRGYEVADR